jgi:hypothetical protein
MIISKKRIMRALAEEVRYVKDSKENSWKANNLPGINHYGARLMQLEWVYLLLGIKKEK